MITFAFSNLASEISDEYLDHELLLRINADFSIKIDGIVFYAERLFPIVEFASQLARWCECPTVDFRYESMESDENALIAFTEVPDSSFKVGSVHSAFQCETHWPREELVKLSMTFCERVVARVREELGVDVSRVVWLSGGHFE